MTDRLHADHARHVLSRRRFLQGAVAVGTVAAVDLGLLSETDAVGPPLGPSDRVLVIIGLDGGNCGLNTVVPYTDGAYYGLRGPLAIAPGSVRPIGDGLGLHPALTYVKERFDADDVAIVRGVGHPDGDLSHFTAMAKVATGAQGTEPMTTGWAGRFLDGSGVGNSFAGVAVGGAPIPLIIRSSQVPVTGLPAYSDGLFGADRTHRWDRLMFDSIQAMPIGGNAKGRMGDLIDASYASAMRDAGQANPLYAGLPSAAAFVRELTLAARVVNLDIGARVLHVRLSGFDNHSGHLAAHQLLLQQIDDGIRAFFETLDPQFTSRVALMTVSEFGRRPRSNSSGGTDHGNASIAMVIGERVKGGLWGAQPSLGALDTNGNLVPTIDVRAVHASVLSRWLRADDREILGRSFEQLDLFHSAPVCAAVPANLRAASSAYMPMPPVRILDTRVGNGAPVGRLAPRRVLELTVLGRGNVPTEGVTAVVMNVTVAEPAGAGYLTVWPTGTPRPEASSLNFVQSQTVPNLVVARVGSNGRVSLFNDGGDVHVLADVCGWFPTGNPFSPLVPARLLDTRNGIGASGKVGPDQSLRLPVAGRGGVPSSGVGAVVLNVTGTEPDSISYLTVWPSDARRPTASNLNLVPNRTTPNLVIAKVADDGTVSIYNAAGRVHVLADVFGWFPPDAGYHPMVPTRIVDTRIGLGARGRLRANGSIDLDALCRGAVPVNASAVVLNVTVAEPTNTGYLTVWPAGQPRPNASNLNFLAREVVPNLVVVRVGVEGMISVYNEVGTPHLIADVMGWFE